MYLVHALPHFHTVHELLSLVHDHKRWISFVLKGTVNKKRKNYIRH